MSQKFNILIPDRISAPADIESNVFGNNVVISAPKATHCSDIDDQLWKSADAILAWHDLDYSEALIRKLESCKILVRVGVGYDNVDLQSAAEQDICVCNVPDYGTNDVADHTLALLLSTWRGLQYYNNRIRQQTNGWKWNSDLNMQRLTDSNLTVIGLGRIGTAVAIRAKAFGMSVTAYDPMVPDGYEKSLNINRERKLSRAVENADIISFHTPLTNETRGMLNREFFENVKQGVNIINTSRGEIIELDALYSAMKSGIVRCAGLDVLEEEPPDFSHPLLSAWKEREPWITGRLLLTPHSAFYCNESLSEMRRKAAETAYQYLENDELRNCVNLQYLE